MAGTGTTLSDLYSSAQRMKLELREGLEQLERLESFADYTAHAGPDPGGGGRVALSPDTVQGLRLKLAELQRVSTEMDRMWRSQVNKAQRDLWRRKVEHIAEEAGALRAALDSVVGREARRAAERAEREELIRRSATGDGAAVVSEMEADNAALATARSSARILEETLQTGYATLKRMAEQREVLKGAQRRALDVLNYMGLSETVLKRIGRRQRVDRWISYGGMLLTVVVVLGVWKLTH